MSELVAGSAAAPDGLTKAQRKRQQKKRSADRRKEEEPPAAGVEEVSAPPVAAADQEVAPAVAAADLQRMVDMARACFVEGQSGTGEEQVAAAMKAMSLLTGVLSVTEKGEAGVLARLAAAKEAHKEQLRRQADPNAEPAVAD